MGEPLPNNGKERKERKERKGNQGCVSIHRTSGHHQHQTRMTSTRRLTTVSEIR
jgi:hypothetical protein